jgi:hypothetical protein
VVFRTFEKAVSDFPLLNKSFPGLCQNASQRRQEHKRHNPFLPPNLLPRLLLALSPALADEYVPYEARTKCQVRLHHC